MLSIEDIRGNWNKYTFEDIKQAYANYDFELKRSFIDAATPESVHTVYADLHRAWREATEGALEYFAENDAYPEPEDEQRLEDLVKLSFFHKESFLDKPNKAKQITPIISVVLPIYKAFRYIWEALRSVYEQTFQDFEVVIVNEYQNDDPIEKIISLFGDKRTRIIQKTEPSKLSKSLNMGIKNSRGEIICRMDGDDIAFPERFEKQIAFFRKNPDIDFLYTGTRTFGIDTMPFQKPVVKLHVYLQAALMVTNPIIHPTVMMRKSAIVQYELWYDEELICEDYELWQRAVRKVKFEGIDKCLLYYRVYPESSAVRFFDCGMEEVYAQQAKNRKDITLSLTDEEKGIINNMQKAIDDTGVLTRYGAQIILASRLGGLHLLPVIFPKFGFGKPEQIRKLQDGRTLIVWGAGIQSAVFRELLRLENMDYIVVDKGMEARGETLPDEEMMLIRELQAASDKYFVAIGTYYRYGGIARQLDQWGYREGSDYIYCFED